MLGKCCLSPEQPSFTLVTRRPYCPGRPKELCFTALSLAMETMEMRLSVVKQSFFGPPRQYGRLVTRANVTMHGDDRQIRVRGHCRSQPGVESADGGE